jgi:hypothetical protein
MMHENIYEPNIEERIKDIEKNVRYCTEEILK